MTTKDYARRPELRDKDQSHVEFMKRPTFEALNRIKERAHSEFKKPYLEGDHVPMEHWADYPFPFMPPFPPFPNFPDPVPTDPESPWNLLPGEEPEEGPALECPGHVACYPDNPTTIAQGGDAVVRVHACPGVLQVSVTPEKYFKTQGVTDLGYGLWAIKVVAESDACGMCSIRCTDPGSPTRGGPWSATCLLKCDTGGWVLKSSTCVMSGIGDWIENGGDPADWELVVGGSKQTQTTAYQAGYQGQGWCDENALCDGVGWEYEPCIDWHLESEMFYNTEDGYLVPCHNVNTPYTNIRCFKTTALGYYEWECE